MELFSSSDMAYLRHSGPQKAHRSSKPSGTTQLVIGSLYRPPRHTVAALQDDFADLETQLQRVLIDLPGVPLVICGDLNCDWLKDHSDPARRRLVEFLSDHFGSCITL